MTRAVILLCLLPLAACASAQAKVAIDKPALEVPPVPPRSVEAPLPPPPEAVLPPVDPLPNPAKESGSRTTKPPQREANRETAKPEAKPDPTPPAEAQPAQPPPAPVVPPLRTPETPAASDAAARAVREVIDRGRKILDTIDWRPLKPELKKEYDNAKQFFQQAEDALKASNYELGRSLADKAERIAKQLQGR